MKYLRVVICLGAIGWSTSSAWAQYGLYGSPEMVRLPQVQATPVEPYDMRGAETPRPIGPAAYSAAPMSAAYMVPNTDSAVQPPNQPLPPAPRPEELPPPPSPSPSDGPMPPVRPQAEQPALEPVPSQGQGVISQMLQDAGCLQSAPVTSPGSLCESSFGQAVCAPGTECMPSPVCDCGPKRWFVTARGLMMTRNKANRLWTTYETGNNPNQIPTEPDWDWRGGAEIRFGRWFGGGCSAVSDCSDCYTDWCAPEICSPCDVRGEWALEGVYWSLASFGDYVSRSIAGGTVSTPLLVDEVFFGVDDPGTNYFDNAREHRVRRKSELHNVEINVLAGQPLLARGALDVQWSVGVRYFRFADELTFGSVQNGWAWGSEGGIHEAYLRDRITNNLVGGQFGFNASYLLGFNLRLFLNPSFGIYGNHIKNRFELYRGDGAVATTNPYMGTYPVNSSDNVVSFLTQIDVGLDWQFSPNWSANIGYRVVAISGIGLADEQIPVRVNDIPDIAEIDYNGNLILHGAFAGLTLRF
jgi:hypothetical protein